MHSNSLRHAGHLLAIAALIATTIMPGVIGCGDDNGRSTEGEIPPPEQGYPVTLGWTAVGDDGESGTASRYDIRYSLDSIALRTSWSLTAPVSGLPEPSRAGTRESVSVWLPLWSDTTYYFAIKAADEAGNWSRLSNLTSVTTPPDTTAAKKGRRRGR
ncbi:hypothetical protein KQH82_07595 [bacterium]|nr:hypothetical protein [bacterium]